MCDCYYGKCYTCSNIVSIHIADYCVPSSNVFVICHECIDKGVGFLPAPYNISEEYHIFFDTIRYDLQVVSPEDKYIGEPGKHVMFVVKNPVEIPGNPYGIHLN